MRFGFGMVQIRYYITYKRKIKFVIFHSYLVYLQGKKKNTKRDKSKENASTEINS